MSTSVPRCPKCNKPIPTDAPLGLCPACVLSGASLGSEAGSRPRAALEIPPIESVRAAFPQLEVLELVGSGGMGVVYHARQPQLDRHVALKILPQSLGSDPAFAERFNREARFLARLSHPNIVAVHDFGQSHGFCFLLMEYVDGVNLREAMRSGRFSPAEALALIPGICDALQYAHSQGVLHRDIKPENLLLDSHGRVRIVDFGVAKLVGEDARDITLTVPGARVGTPHYMAPEQVEKPSDVDHRADIYSLGVVLYELLTGELPLGRFAAPSAKAWLDARVDAIVLRALAKERELRQQSANEVKSDVEGLGKVRSETAPIPESRPSRWGNGRLLGLPILAPGTNGPKLHWPGMGSGWLGLVAILLPLGWFFVVTQFGSMLLPRLVFVTLLILGFASPAILGAFVGIERGLLRVRGAQPSPLPAPAPMWARIAGWALLLWAFAWTGMTLASFPNPDPAGFRQIDLGGEWMLLPACLALWSGHYGWRRYATVFGAFSLGATLVGGLSALAHWIPGVPPMTTPQVGIPTPWFRALGGSVAFLGSLCLIWAPALSHRFQAPGPWFPNVWRRRLSIGLYTIALALACLAGFRFSRMGTLFESTARVEIRGWFTLEGWSEATRGTWDKFPGCGLLLQPSLPESTPADPSAETPRQAYRIQSSSFDPDQAVEALNFALEKWASHPSAGNLQITSKPSAPAASPAPYQPLFALVAIALLLTVPAAYFHLAHPIPPRRLFRMIVALASIALLVDLARRLLT